MKLKAMNELKNEGKGRISTVFILFYTESLGVWEEQFWWGQQEKGRFPHDTDHKNPPGKIESGGCMSVKPPGTAT